MRYPELFKRIRQELDKIPVIDTHEHLTPEQERVKTDVNLFSLFESSYVGQDFLSAGFPAKNWQLGKTDPEKCWEVLKHYLPYVRNTAYYKSYILAFKELYGFEDDDINDSNWRWLSEQIQKNAKKEGWYKFVLREKGNIERCIWDYENLECDQELFAPVKRMDDFIMATHPGQPQSIGARYGIGVHSLDDFLKALDIAFQQVVDKGGVGIKSALAYQRIIRYDKISKGEAERIFNRILSGEEVSSSDQKIVQDFMMHQVIRRTIEHKLPFQIHTGIQAGNGNWLTNTDPTHLLNLFMDYNEARFDIFHGGYPYTSQLCVMAKNFPNVYVNLCWLHIISPTVSGRMLAELVDTVPANKIFAFGGDYINVEGTLGHLLLAKNVIAGVLTKKVAIGYLTEDEALALAKLVLHDAPAQFYGVT